MKKRLIRIALLAIPTLVLAAGIAWWQIRNASSSGNAALASVGGPFELVNQTGETVTEESWPGQYKFIAFGFTFCPDVCPTELSQMAVTLDLLGEDAAEVQPIFITIDPERDTPEKLDAYVSLFHDRLVGLTGTPEQVAEAAKAYRVYYQKVETEGTDDYLMDHSAFIYLVDPDGTTVEIFPYGTSADDMAATIGNHLDA